MERALTTPKNAHEAYVLATKEISAKELSQILDCSLTHIYRMGASKKTNGETRRNPIIQARKIVEELIKRKSFEAAFIIADTFAGLIGGEIAFRDHTPDKDTYQEELLDSQMAVTDLMTLCQLFMDGNATREQVRAAKKKAHSELDQLVGKAFQTLTDGRD